MTRFVGPITRREFLNGATLVAAAAATASITKPWRWLFPQTPAAVSPPIDAKIGAPVKPSLSEILRNPVSLEAIRDDVAAAFAANTGLSPEDNRIRTNWHWLLNPSDVTAFRQQHPVPQNDFSAVTVFEANGATPTYVNIPRILNFNNDATARDNPYSDDELAIIFQEILAHEMERKIQTTRNYTFPVYLRSTADWTNQIGTVGSARGFNMFTPAHVDPSDIADGTEVPRRHEPQRIAIYEPIDNAATELAAALTLGEHYNAGRANYRPGQQYRNFALFLDAVGISATEALQYHRNSDPIAFGHLIAEKVGYHSAAPYDQIKTQQGISSGLGLALYATVYGPGKEFNDLQKELRVNINYN